MSAMGRIIKRANLHRQAKSQRKLAKKTAIVKRSPFVIESLEPRILLSADVLPSALIADLNSAAGPAPIVAPLDAGKVEAAPQRAIAGPEVDTLTIARQVFDGEIPIRSNDANNQPADHSTLSIAPQLADLPLPPLVVSSFGPTTTGFSVRFNRAIEPSVLSLYDIEAGTFGAADATLVGSTVGAVKGSLVVNNDLLTFVAHGGVLAPDTYNVTLRAAANAIRDASGNLLDGDNDGTGGGNYTNSFAVTPSSVAGLIIGLPDFARGPGQVVNVPGSETGIPVTLSDGAGVTSVSLTLRYDSALLTIKSVLAGADLPAAAVVTTDLSQSGVAIVRMTLATALGAGAKTLFRLSAEVPHTAAYGKAAVLDIAEVSINNGAIPSLGDDSVQAVAYFGETTGNQRYSALDGQRTLRVAAGLDTGFAAYSAIDPAIVADITGNGAISALDGTRILQEVAGLDRAEIQPITPVIVPGLLHDNGISASDGLTNDATISGAVSDDSGIAAFQVGLDGSNLVNALGDLNGSSFSFTKARLEQLLGAPLSDGSHSLRFQATDNQGNTSTISQLNFAFDTSLPAITAFGLSAGSDSGTPGDNITSAGIVSLVGTSEAGAMLKLGTTDILVGAGGTFQIPDVALIPGANTITITSNDAAGNSAQRDLTITRQGVVTADVALQWNTLALDAIRMTVTDPPVASRILAIVSLAQYDTLAAIENTPAFLVKQSASGPVHLEAALAKAAHTVLYAFFPSLRATFDTALNTLLSSIPDGAAKTNALDLGLSVGNAILAIRADDGSSDFVAYEGSSAIGQWRPTAPMFEIADEPQWGEVTPFALTSSDEFRPVAPPALDSAAYAAGVSEVKSLGSATSTSRSSDQTEQAQFWADGKGSYTPAGHWNVIAQSVSLNKANSLSANVRLFAQLNVALADSGIAAWDAKYTYGLWRPIDAIQNADQDNNPATIVDQNWTSLLITPSHPEFVSGHSSYSAAAAAILANTFGDSTAFSTTAFTLPGVSRNFTSFTQAAQEAGRSRIYGGIHYEFTNQAGQQLGQQIAQAVIAKFALNQDTQAPNIIADNSALTTNANINFTGQIVDNLSGLAKTEYQIDGGPLVTLLVDNQGGFSITTVLNLDGSADGAHSITVTASDAAGNLTFVSRSFLLDTRLPVVSLTSPGDGAAIDGASRLTGSADATGSALTVLNYQIDNGPARSIGFDSSTGSFDEALILGNLAVGTHSLKITARDAAGNQSTLTRSVTLANATRLTVTGITPGDGSNDVGTTFRPQVFFSKAIDQASLNANNFFAADSAGNKLAATIVPAADGSFAWLFISNPMPGGETITINVDGATIRSQDGAQLLDADGDGSPGGLLQYRFTTVNLEPIPGTILTGRVLDPGPDLEPMTFDDIRRGPDGIIHTADDQFLNPLAGVKVFILGRESEFVLTDAQGRFTLTNVPAGNVKLAVDGHSATNVPQGIFFPEMVLDLTVEPGVTNTAMGSMGTAGGQRANESRNEIYLPRVQQASLQAVSNGQNTTIVVDANAAPNLTDSQRGQLKLVVQPGSLLDANGNLLNGGQVGISTVPPELVRDMLPEGVLQHTFDITIQAPGAAVFNAPLQITFPNVFNAAPGSKLNFLSFDHTTGRLVIEGTATVSADGLSVTSDPGSGITKPGWHGLTDAGCNVGGPLPPPPPPPCKEEDDPLDDAKDWSDSLSDVLECAGQFSQAIRKFGNVFTILNDSVGLLLDMKSFFEDAKKAAAQGASEKVLLGFVELAQTYKERIQKIAEIITDTAQEAAGFWLKIAECIGPALSIAERVCENLMEDPCEEIGVFGAAACTAIQAAKEGFEAGQLAYERFKGDLKSLVSVQAACLITEQFTNVLKGYLKPGSNPPSGGTTTIALGPALAPAVDDTLALNNLIDQFVQQTNAVISGNAEYKSDVGAFSAAVGASANAAYGIFPASARLSTSLNGLPRAGFYRALFGDSEVRGLLGASGQLNLFISAQTDFTIQTFDPATGLIGIAYGRTPRAGVPVRLPGLLQFSDSADQDQDGLGDLAEQIVGSNPTLFDSDGDGVSDLAEIRAGTDPLGGRALPSGVVGALSLQGEAKGIAIEGSTGSAEQLTAYVATGSFGLAVVDAAQFRGPLVLGQLDLPGDSVDVSVDAALGIAAVASGAGGLNLVSVANPNTPQLRQTISFNATQVEVFEGIAYTSAGAELRAYDLWTGEKLAALTGSANITGLARAGRMLFTMDANRLLRAVDISGSTLTARGSVTMPAAGNKLFVANGIAYIAAGNGATGGFMTANVSNPDAPTLLSGIDNNGVSGTAIALNGSGLAVVAGSSNFGGFRAVDVMNVADPANTGNLITRFNLPQVPFDIAIGAGIAFVADGNGDLQVVNYRSIDNSAVAPTITVAIDVLDVDPATPGIQVVEGPPVNLLSTISDDVQVRNVELLQNGAVIRNDVSFPFELSVFLPTITAEGSDQVTLQVRATDTGGNSTLSTPIVLQLVPDTFGPTLLASNVSEGGVVGRNFRSVLLSFSEAIDEVFFGADAVQLIDGNSSAIAAQNIQFRLDAKQVQATFAQQTPGSYTLRLDRAQIRDRAGNAMGAGFLDVHFTIKQSTIEWIGSGGGNWNTAANWSTGLLPTAIDEVFIPVTSSPITISSGTIAVQSLISQAAVTLSGGTLTLNGVSQIDGAFIFSGGTLAGGGTLTLNGTGNQWTGGTMTGTGITQCNSNLAITGIGDKGLSGNRVLNLAGTTTWSGNTGANNNRIVFSGGTINNSGTWNDNNNFDTLLLNFSGVNAFNNSGTYNKQGNTVTLMDVPFTNPSTFNVNAGTLRSIGGGTYTGSFNIAGSATLDLNSGTHNLNNTTTISGAGTLSISGASAFNFVNLNNITLPTTVVISGGTVQGSGATFAGAVTWSAGTFTGAGNFTFNNTLAITGIGDKGLSGNRVLNLAGTTTWSGNTGASNNRIVFSGGTINNSGTWNDSNSFDTLLLNFSGVNAFNNSGTYNKQGNTVTLMDVPFTNPSTFNVNAGTLRSIGGGTYTGSFNIAGSATLDLNSGTHNLNNTTTINGAGTLLISGASAFNFVNLNNIALPTTVVISGGTVQGSGATFAGAVTWSAGTFTGAGIFTFDNTLAITGNSDKGLSGNRILNLAGTTTWSGNTVASNNRIVFSGGTINNNGIWNDANSFDTLLLNFSGVNAFNNSGTYNKQGNTVTLMDVPFSNPSTFNVNAGTLRSIGGGTYTGAFNIAGSATLDLNSGTHNLNNTTAISGAGTLSISGASAFNFVNLNNITLPTTVVISGGTVQGSGATFAGAVTWSAGTFTGAGSFTFDNTLAITGNSDKNLSGNRILNLNGTTTWSGNTVASNNRIVFSGGTINNLGTWNDSNSFVTTILSFSGVNTFNNSGTYNKQGSATTTIGTPFNNTGTLEAQTGTLSFSGNFSQSAGTTRLNGGNLAGGVTFNLQGGTLAGAGTITGNVTNAGTINVGGTGGAGNLQISGNYTQTVSGSTQVEIGGVAAGTEFDRLVITGAATLAGTLNLALINGFAPSNGQSFQVVAYASHGTSTFNTISGLSIGGGLSFNPTYNATNLTLTAAPSPAPGLEASALQNEAPQLTSDTTVSSVDAPPVTNALVGATNDPLGGLTLDLEQSAEISRKTGKEWLFYIASG